MQARDARCRHEGKILKLWRNSQKSDCCHPEQARDLVFSATYEDEIPGRSLS